jgi:hypothetical protein
LLAVRVVVLIGAVAEVLAVIAQALDLSLMQIQYTQLLWVLVVLQRLGRLTQAQEMVIVLFLME